MTVSAGDIFRVALEWSLPDLVTAYNVLGLVNSTGTCTDAELLTAVDAWLVTALAFVQTTISDDVDVVEARVSRMLWSLGEWVVTEVLGTVFPVFTATDATDMLPHAVAGVITFPTIAPTRKGKVFLPGLTDNDAIASTLSAGALTALGNFATNISAPLLPGTAVLWYNILCNDGITRGALSYRVNALSGTQRRRKPGVGI